MNVYKIHQSRGNQIWGDFWVLGCFVFFFSSNKIAWLNGSQMRSLLQSIVISKTDNWKLSYSNKH